MPDSIEDLDDKALIKQYRATVEHLLICDQHGQIDNQQIKEQQVLKEEILERMSSKEE